jgi:hypothetical protein
VDILHLNLPPTGNLSWFCHAFSRLSKSRWCHLFFIFVVQLGSFPMHRFCRSLILLRKLPSQLLTQQTVSGTLSFSGLPEASVLLSQLFNIFINDLGNAINCSMYLNLADNLKIYRVINPSKYWNLLQSDMVLYEVGAITGQVYPTSDLGGSNWRVDG